MKAVKNWLQSKDFHLFFLLFFYLALLPTGRGVDTFGEKV